MRGVERRLISRSMDVAWSWGERNNNVTRELEKSFQKVFWCDACRSRLVGGKGKIRLFPVNGFCVDEKICRDRIQGTLFFLLRRSFEVRYGISMERAGLQSLDT